MVDRTVYAWPYVLPEIYPLEKQRSSVPCENAIFEERLQPQVLKVFICHAMGKVLAEDIIALEDIPNKNEATMDGYAVRISDLDSSHGRLKICSGSYRSESSAGLPPCAAVYVRNGGMLPNGADTIVRVEETILKGREILVEGDVSPGDYVREKGSEARKDQIILRRGTKINFAVTGILGILGKNKILVYDDMHRKCHVERPSRIVPFKPGKSRIQTPPAKGPKVTVFSTGNEIVPPEEKKQDREIYEKNSYVLSAMLKERNFIPAYGGILPDDTEAISTACVDALVNTDYVLISGGTSVGRADKIPSVFNHLRKTFGFTIMNSSTIPERKQIAYLGCKVIWAMPGRTVRAAQIFIVEVWPMLNSLSGAKQPHFNPSRLVRATLVEGEFWNNPSSSPFVKIIKRPNEENIAIPLPFYREFTCLSNMNAMVLSPKNGKDLVPGKEIIAVKLF